MQRRRMRMAPDRVVAVWILARVQQQANDFDATKLRCQRECQMAVATAAVEAMGASRQFAQEQPPLADRRERHG